MDAPSYVWKNKNCVIYKIFFLILFSMVSGSVFIVDFNIISVTYTNTNIVQFEFLWNHWIDYRNFFVL